MSQIDEDSKNFVRMLRYVSDCVYYAQEVQSYPDCNTCGKRNNCEYLPDFGELVRINCPLWEKRGNSNERQT